MSLYFLRLVRRKDNGSLFPPQYSTFSKHFGTYLSFGVFIWGEMGGGKNALRRRDRIKLKKKHTLPFLSLTSPTPPPALPPLENWLRATLTQRDQ